MYIFELGIKSEFEHFLFRDIKMVIHFLASASASAAKAAIPAVAGAASSVVGSAVKSVATSAAKAVFTGVASKVRHEFTFFSRISS